jgi:hypothetical protein
MLRVRFPSTTPSCSCGATADAKIFAQSLRRHELNYKKEKISSYEEYEIDTNGVVYRKNGTPMKQTATAYGYLMVNLTINGMQKGVMVHRLVASQFIPNAIAEKNQVNHID